MILACERRFAATQPQQKQNYDIPYGAHSRKLNRKSDPAIHRTPLYQPAPLVARHDGVGHRHPLPLRQHSERGSRPRGRGSSRATARRVPAFTRLRQVARRVAGGLLALVLRHRTGPCAERRERGSIASSARWRNDQRHRNSRRSLGLAWSS